ncbi:hypothetical protein V865_007162 [Kwoniella europaea PYCC6329]|uniref:TPR-like protein n=1 Tax=Kwoniella europaea PYCC6329 TaxID=1423913 RepID=A0AAX4KS19_9TREE
MSTSAAAGPGPKGVHYNTSLTAALLRGAWAESNPGHAPNKTELSWGELVRKWGKHTGGNTSLIHHLRDISLLYLSSTSHSTTSSSGYLTVSSTQAGSSVINEAPGSSNSSNDSAGTANTGSHSSFVHIPHPHLRHRKKASLDIPDASSSSITGSGSSTIRPSDVGTSSKASYLSSGDLDGDETDDPRGWAEGNLWWNGVSPEGVDEVREGIKSLEGLIVSGKLSRAETTSAQFILAYHLHALGSHEGALKIYEGIDWNSENRFGAVQGDSAVLERIRARCLQGLSYELAQNPDYQKSIQSYLLTIPLLQSLSSYNLPTPTYLSNQTSPKATFDPQREVYRWISTALTRAAALSARQPHPTTQDSQNILRILRTYSAFSSSWPPSFRPIQRQRMLSLYLRALESSYPSPRQPPSESPLLYSTIVPSTTSARASWSKEVIETIHQGRTLLQSTTSFPRAGSINRPVTEFSELAVSLYSKSAELGREVISVLWWSMTLTFQSQTILRHLTHLLADIGDSLDARRVFELYVQLVLKARETQQPEVSLQLKRRPTNEDAASPEQIQKQLEDSDTSEEQKGHMGAESEIDSDKQFIETLLAGTRLLARDLGEIEDAWRYVVLAGDVLNTTGGIEIGITDELKARIEEAKGIVRMGLAVHNADTIDRPTYQAQAINHLTAAIDLFPSSSGYYHLAHCQSEARSIDAATQSIRSSLEMDPTNVQAWHLLALLLTARRDWEGALKACEAGISVWEADEEISSSQEDLVDDNEVESKDFAVQAPTPTNPSSNTGRRDGTTASSLINKDGSFPHLSISPPKVTPLSKSARLEHVIRLRMTLNVIIEKIQGPELAMLKQQELFAFFSARSGKNRKKLGYSSGFGKSNGMKSVASSSSLTALPGTEGEKVEDLGGSFVSVGVNDGGLVSVQPPTPMIEKTQLNAIALAPPISEKPPITVQSPSPSPSPTPTPQPSNTGALISEGEDEKSRRRSLSVRSKKHLHVPGQRQAQVQGVAQPVSAPVSRPSSIRRLSSTSPTIQQQGVKERSASAAQSLAPTAIHSHFRNYAPSSRTILPPPPPIQQPTMEEHGRTPAESRILSNLWLMSAATFRRWGKLEQCLVAIEEAEVLDPENPDVWVQLGMYHQVINKQNPSSSTTTNDNEGEGESKPTDNQAESSFVKSLLIKPDHSSAIIGLSKIYLESHQVDLAEILLNSLTQEKGWDLVQAWYLLGKVCESQGRNTRARECWEFALGLERSGPVREWNQVGRWL